jgi:hypothetical protein
MNSKRAEHRMYLSPGRHRVLNQLRQGFVRAIPGYAGFVALPLGILEIDHD